MLNDVELIKTARKWKDDRTLPAPVSEVLDTMADRYESALLREQAILVTARDKAVFSRAIAEAYQDKIAKQNRIIDWADHLIRTIKADRPSAHSDAIWESIHRFLERDS